MWSNFTIRFCPFGCSPAVLVTFPDRARKKFVLSLSECGLKSPNQRATAEIGDWISCDVLTYSPSRFVFWWPVVVGLLSLPAVVFYRNFSYYMAIRHGLTWWTFFSPYLLVSCLIPLVGGASCAAVPAGGIWAGWRCQRRVSVGLLVDVLLLIAVRCVSAIKFQMRWCLWCVWLRGQCLLLCYMESLLATASQGSICLGVQVSLQSRL